MCPNVSNVSIGKIMKKLILQHNEKISNGNFDQGPGEQKFKEGWSYLLNWMMEMVPPPAFAYPHETGQNIFCKSN